MDSGHAAERDPLGHGRVQWGQCWERRGGQLYEPACVVPEVGQGAEYGAECPHRRLYWVVSHTPRAGFHVASGAGGGGEESADILDHHQAGTEGFDRADHLQPKARAGTGGESGAAAGDGDVFDTGSLRSARTPPERRPSSRW